MNVTLREVGIPGPGDTSRDVGFKELTLRLLRTDPDRAGVENPAAGAPNGKLNREALQKLRWLVVRDWFEIESASFWYKGPESPNPRTIGTEVFFLPVQVPRHRAVKDEAVEERRERVNLRLGREDPER